MRRLSLTLAFFAVAVMVLPACGRSRRYRDEGDIVVDNQTILTTNEDLLSFRVAAFGDPFSGDFLGGIALPEGGSRYIGEFDEDYYDAEGDLELGQVIEWFDEFVGDDRRTTFEVR